MNANTDYAIANFLEAIQIASGGERHCAEIEKTLVNKCRVMLQAYTVELITEDNKRIRVHP